MESKCCYDGTHQRRRYLTWYQRYRAVSHHQCWRQTLPHICKFLLFKRCCLDPLKLAQCLLAPLLSCQLTSLLACKCACLATFTTFGEEKTSQLSLVVSANHIYANASRAPPAKEQLVWTRWPVPVVSASCLARTR